MEKASCEKWVRPWHWGGLLCVLIPLAFMGASTGDAQTQSSTATSPFLDLNAAVVVVPADTAKPEQKAVEMLLDEVEKRTTIRWNVVHEWPGATQTAILVGMRPSLAKLATPLADKIAANPPKGPEGYALQAVGSTVIVAGNDVRGTLFGVGHLLRELRMVRNSVTLSPTLAINTAPKCALRGHQMGYRPKVNSYDGWTLPMWEQYIRDLVVFGTNAIEVMPPKTDDKEDSPHYPLPPIEMTARISKLADEYGLSVWVWFPALGKDYEDPAKVEGALKEWSSIFEALPRVDAVFVPGGDPGDTPPNILMPMLGKLTDVLHRSHPQAQMWMSPQGFKLEWMNLFLKIVQEEKPAWLSGVVFAPQNRLSFADLRKAIPSQYPIRHYPDITHTFICQYPVQDWDTAYKITEDREIVNPRPEAYAQIFRWSNPYTIGFISYSEGVNDDVNKILWSALGWDPDTDVFDILRQYSRYFIGLPYENDFAHAIASLEKNWQGPLLTNSGVTKTLHQVQDMEQQVTPQVLLNWRFQQVQYRAYFDAYIRCRLIHETELEAQATEVLNRAEEIGSLFAMDEAQSILNKALTERVGLDLRGRVSDMAEALYQSIRMQMSVPRYRAVGLGRGTSLDTIDACLNNRLWFEKNFTALRALPDENDRLARIHELTHWTDPGPGGFYDELGNPMMNSHLVRNVTTEFDPENRTNPLLGFARGPRDKRISCYSNAETRFEAPLKMHYEKLDPSAQYKVRAVHAGDKLEAKLRLVANDTIEIHPFISKDKDFKPVEFDIPKEATASGQLTLSWTQEPGIGSAGRGCQVAEVWLIKKTTQP